LRRFITNAERTTREESNNNDKEREDVHSDINNDNDMERERRIRRREMVGNKEKEKIYTKAKNVKTE
jgi:hypothetical protein